MSDTSSDSIQTSLGQRNKIYKTFGLKSLKCSYYCKSLQFDFKDKFKNCLRYYHSEK